MVFAFSSNVFTLIVITALPTMIGAFLFFDVRYYNVWISEERYQKQLGWVKLERLFLHPPMIVAGFGIYLNNSIEFLLTMFTLPNLIAGLILGFAP
jgi:hypothetical protein